MNTEYATPENDLPYVPDLHVSGTTKKQGKLIFWLSNPLFEAGYKKINWKETHEGNKLE